MMDHDSHIKLNPKAKFKHGFKAESERKSLHYRNSLGIKKYHPLDSKTLAKNLDVQLKTPSQIFKSKNRHFDILMGDGSDSWSGATIPDGSGGFIVLY